MNAMRRADAVDRLEDYSFVIVEHLGLCCLFPEHSVYSHWKTEINAFTKALVRANKARGGGKNFGPEMVSLALQAVLEREISSENLSDIYISKGMALQKEPNWNLVRDAILEYSKQF